MIRRLVTTLLVAATLLPALGATLPAGAAAPTKTYHNAKFGYSVTYPSNWKPFKAAGTDIAIETADTGAVFDAATEGNATKPTAADLKDAVGQMLGSAGVPKTAKITYGTRVLHGQTFTMGTGLQSRTNGQKVTFTGYVGYQNHSAYVFMTALVTSINGVKRPEAIGQAAALDRIVSSITVTGPAK